MTKNELKAGVLALLAGGANWTQNATARDVNGVPVPSGSDAAVKWDLHGAILKTLGYTRDFRGYHELLDDIYAQIKPGAWRRNIDIDLYNDQHTWAEVAALLA